MWLVSTDDKGIMDWMKTFGGEGSDYGSSIAETEDGNYIITGGTDHLGQNPMELWLLKINSEGDTLWARTYGGIEEEDGCNAQQTDDGGFIVFGITSSPPADGANIWLLKTDYKGDTLWTRIYGRDQGSAWTRHGEKTFDGGYIIQANEYYLEADSAMFDNWLLRLDSNGDTIWTKRCGQGGLYEYDELNFVEETSDSGFIVIGGNVSFDNITKESLWLFKLDKNGNTEWNKYYQGPSEDGAGVMVRRTIDGGYIVLGGVFEGPWLLKLDNAGDTVWTKIYDIGEESWSSTGCFVCQTTDKGFIIVGHGNSSATGSNVWLLKTDSLGLLGVSEPSSPVTHQPSSPATHLEIPSPIGSEVTLRYSNCPNGFRASVFNASGREVDEIQSPQSEGIIQWPVTPLTQHDIALGVYFIVPEGSKAGPLKVELEK